MSLVKFTTTTKKVFRTDDHLIFSKWNIVYIHSQIASSIGQRHYNRDWQWIDVISFAMSYINKENDVSGMTVDYTMTSRTPHLQSLNFRRMVEQSHVQCFSGLKESAQSKSRQWLPCKGDTPWVPQEALDNRDFCGSGSYHACASKFPEGCR